MKRLAATLAARARSAGGDDGGTAIVEFIFVALVIMVPLVYLIVAVSVVQRNQLAVAQAARNAGRAYVTSDTPAQGRVRVATAVRLAMRDQRFPDDATWRFVAANAECDDKHAITPGLTPGAEFAVCVTRRTALPGVPSVLSGKKIATTSKYIVHVDDFRVAGRAHP